LVVAWTVLGVTLLYTVWHLSQHPFNVHSLPLLQHQSQKQNKYSSDRIPITNTNREAKPTIKKTILYWNEYWNFDFFQFGQGQQPFLDAGCPISDCVALSYNSKNVKRNWTKQELGAVDAVLIHGVDLAQETTLLRDIQQQWRQTHQTFVYMTMESPLSHYSQYENRRHYATTTAPFRFNWTMTYRRDSTLPRPYGFFQRIQSSSNTNQSYYPIQFNPEPKFLQYNETHFLQHVLPRKPQSFHNLATKRSKGVAWIVSRCNTPSRREDYVAKLSEYIDVDIMGECGTIPCNESFHVSSNNKQNKKRINDGGTTTNKVYTDNCTTTVAREYKFYLAFENSFCQDYVTEKFFRHLSLSNVVIVLGGANYSTVAPPHSFLNVLDYSSPQALAFHLNKLDQNDSLYLSYFWWQDYYRVHTGSAADHASTMCRLCELLHNDDNSNDNESNITITASRKEGGIVYPLDVISWQNEQCLETLPKVLQDNPRKKDANNEIESLLDD